MSSPSDVRNRLNAARDAANRDALNLHEPQLVAEQLASLYRSLGADDRAVADLELQQWLESDDEALRFDAMAMIDEFKVASALHTLRSLSSRLSGNKAPGAPYERAKVDRLIQRLVTP